MTVDIEVFGLLDDIRAKYDVNAEKWAIQAGLHPARITELRHILELHRRSQPIEGTGRIFSFTKCNALVGALKEILGAAIVQKELLKRLESAEDSREKIHILTMMLTDSQREQALLYLKALVLPSAEDH